jgi:hypothetical protein
MTATIPMCLAWLAAFTGSGVLLLAAVCAVGPLHDRRTMRRRLRASKVARPVTGEHYAAPYMTTRALGRGVRLAAS